MKMKSNADTTPASEFARFTGEMTFNDLSVEVREKVKDMIMDQIGIQLACATLPWSKTLIHVIQELGGNQVSTVAYYGMKTSAEHAAFCNASFGHGFEIDDIHTRATNHPGCLGIPTTLSMGEWVHTDGKEFITAAALAMEVMLRLTLLAGTPLLRQGQNTHPPTAAFGLAGGAARLLGLDHNGILNACTLAGSYSIAGLREYTVSGGSLKRTYAGIPAQIGIRSALLAKYGMTGPPTILEGRWGLLRVVCGLEKPDLRSLTHGLGKEWLLLETSHKRYAACYYTHAAIEACQKLKAANDFSVSDVDSVTVGVADNAIRHTGTIREPKDILSAQFSLGFTTALVLAKGSAGFHDYTEENLRDPKVLGLAHRIHMVVDPQAESEYPYRWSARVTIRLKDGREMTEYVNSFKGFADDPMTRDDLEEKFRDLTGPFIDSSHQDRMLSTIGKLDQMPDIAPLAHQLVVR
jgi:2-methylcitrate dehydratase PrpD